MELEKRKTLGEERIRVNLDDQNEVDLIGDLKRKIAIIIDQVNSVEQKGSEHGRLKSIALTELESASMWITKALTY
ncbi:Acb2/Tad1 domain-containing protein [Flavobacterium sp.]|uniref:Acb2/Tad1 domain-containing protein n=1 Tax=Flavobacterium sp. TaxID=239 RepID=UPI00404883B8